LPTSYTFVCEINLKAQEIEFEYHICAHGHVGVRSSVLDGSIRLKHRAEADMFIQRRNASAIQHRQNSNSHLGTTAVLAGVGAWQHHGGQRVNMLSIRYCPPQPRK